MLRAITAPVRAVPATNLPGGTSSTSRSGASGASSSLSYRTPAAEASRALRSRCASASFR